MLSVPTAATIVTITIHFFFVMVLTDPNGYFASRILAVIHLLSRAIALVSASRQNVVEFARLRFNHGIREWARATASLFLCQSRALHLIVGDRSRGFWKFGFAQYVCLNV